MAEEIINIQIVEQVDNINIIIDEVVENVAISIQEPSQTSDLVNNGSDGVHPFITLQDIPSGAVTSVNGQTGDVTIAVSDNNYTTTEKNKLAGIQAGATANDTDANLKNRANHTGTQLAATISDFATSVASLITNKVDKITGYSLTKNDLTDVLKTAYDNAVSSLTSLLATGQRLITTAEITKLSNTSGTNTGDQNLSDLVPYTGASTDVDLNTKNLKVNNVFEGFTSVAASATQIVLTVSSTPSYLVTGSGGQTIKLPNATTLQNGAIYDFNNNQSSGAISVNNNSNTLVKSIPSGGYLVLTLIDNSTTAGSWDAHFQAPSNVSWSTNTFDVPASITSATWNGVNIADNRIASATNWNAKEDSSNKVTTFTGNETSTTKFPVVKAILDYFTAANIKTILGITTLSGSNTGDQDLSGYTPTTRTINTYPLSSNITLTTADVADSTGKRYQTENQKTYNDATSSIQTQLNGKQASLVYNPYRYLNTTQSTTTGTLTETVVATATITGGTFNANDVMKMLFQANKGTTTSNVTLRIKIGSTSTFASATTIATYTFTTTTGFVTMQRSFSLAGGNINTAAPTSTLLTDIFATSASLTAITANPANTLYVFFSVQLGTSLDSVTFTMANISN
jgi:hypothetical protein